MADRPKLSWGIAIPLMVLFIGSGVGVWFIPFSQNALDWIQFPVALGTTFIGCMGALKIFDLARGK